MTIQFSVKRVTFFSSFGFLIIFAAVACASSGCTDQEPNLGTWTESGDEVLPPDDEPPTDPEPLCGTEVYAVDAADLPSNPPVENGYPFQPLPGVGATVMVVPNGVNDRIALRLFLGNGVTWEGTVAYGWNRPADGFSILRVEDVIVHGEIITVVWSQSFYGDHDGDPATPPAFLNATNLTPVDALRLQIGSPQYLTSDPYKTHRIAWDGAQYRLAQYDPNFRTLLHATVAYGIRSNWESVVTLDAETNFTFESVTADADGTFHANFRFTDDPTSGLRVDYRSCQ